MDTTIEFKSIVKQARGIAYTYKVVGLYSTVLLTLTTVISMTNVFLSGTFARYPWIAGVWAFVFATTIDLNIVRMFVEGAIEHAQEKKRCSGWIPFVIGSGLAIVTGVALFIEGLEQSVGLNWHTQTVQVTITVLIAFRVFFVVVLMAREGTKLGHLLHSVLSASERDATPLNAPVEHVSEHLDETPQNTPEQPMQQQVFVEDAQPDVEEKHTDTLRVLHSVQTPEHLPQTDELEQQVRRVLETDPTLSVRSVAKQVGVSHTKVYPHWKRHRSEMSA